MSWFREVMNLLYPTPTPVVRPVISDLCDALNEQRSKFGLSPLVLHPRLNEAAQGWADKMAATGKFTHGDWSGRISHIFPNTPDAENIAMGETVAQIVEMWMHSPGHRRSILHPHYNRLGLGEARSLKGQIYWVADFDTEV